MVLKKVKLHTVYNYQKSAVDAWNLWNMLFSFLTLLIILLHIFQNHGDQKVLMPIIAKFIRFLNKFVTSQPQKSAVMLQKHVKLLRLVFYQNITMLRLLYQCFQNDQLNSCAIIKALWRCKCTGKTIFPSYNDFQFYLSDSNFYRVIYKRHKTESFI